MLCENRSDNVVAVRNKTLPAALTIPRARSVHVKFSLLSFNTATDQLGDTHDWNVWSLKFDRGEMVKTNRF